MITKAEISELVISKLTGGQNTPERKVDPREVWKEVEMARNYLVEKAFNLARTDNTYTIPGEFISSLPADVLKDETRNLHYSILPARFVSLNNNRGLRQISPIQNEKISFIMIQPGSQFVYAGLEAENLGGEIGFWLEENKIWYQVPPAKATEFCSYEQVLVKLVRSLDDYPSDKPIPIPAEYEWELLQRVQASFGIQQQQPQDKVNDNNPTT